jgi:hypothetical protein
LVNPNRSIDAAICRTCFLECVRALRAYGLECGAETWLGASGARHVEVLSEQMLAQKNGWATVLLHAELRDG